MHPASLGAFISPPAITMSHDAGVHQILSGSQFSGIQLQAIAGGPFLVG
jgi:hypothetical protein